MRQRTRKGLLYTAALAAAFLTGGGAALLYVYLHPVMVLCAFHTLAGPMPLPT